MNFNTFIYSKLQIRTDLILLTVKSQEENGSFKFLPSGSKEEDMKSFGREFGRRFAEECAQK